MQVAGKIPSEYPEEDGPLLFRREKVK